MKQAIIELKKKLLLVELPEQINGDDVSVIHNQDDYDQLEFQYPTHEFRGLQCYDCGYLPKGNNYKPIGKLTDITEEQFHKWSGSYEWEDAPEGSKYAYKDYKDGKETDEYWDMYPFDTAKESFFSKLEAEGIYFENPLGEELMKWNKYESIHKKIPHTPYSLYKKDWQEAQEKLWNRDNTYIFEIL